MTAYLLIGVLAAAGLLGLLVARSPIAARAVAVGASGFVAIVATGAMLRTSMEELHETAVGLQFGELVVPLDLGTSRTTAAIAFVVALVTAAVQIYSTWYLASDDRQGIFAANVSIFSAAMLLVVFSRDLVLTLIGWEVMGWCSYLLIGHWSRKASARRAALKAFLVTRLADIGFVLGVVGLAIGARTTRLDDVVSTWAQASTCDALGACTGPDAVLRNVLMCLLVIGVLGKSASVPFQDWLADAMEGPTPASALIHAATMVAAGTVVLGSIFPVLAQAEAARWLLGIATAITMVLAAVLALGQSDLKRLLAWSTVSQVAIMLSALASAPAADGPGAGLFHMWSHAIFKSLLFLALGLLSVIVGGTSAVALRGSAMRSRLGRWALLFGLLSLSGVPILVGGVSKEHVVEEVYAGAIAAGPGMVVLLALLLTVVLTAAYSTRAYLVVAELIDVPATIAAEHAVPESRRHRRQATLDPAGRGAANAVLLVLSVLSIVGGLAITLRLFEVGESSWTWTAVTVLLIAVGCGFAFALAREGDPGVRFVRGHSGWFDRGFGADTAYLAVARPVVRLARVVAFLDREVIDGYVQGAAASTRIAGALAELGHRAERARLGVWLVGLGLILVLAVGVLPWR
ncbi:MAG TPA: proton-conducting transporter membrane subunit [Phycicoccus sp.]|nr:proton-conducting transporter membrane subunit [Phycicoccus sp.]HQY97321.1 proton-conducting transporter membrane subunit [Phycicoccus sp.]